MRVYQYVSDKQGMYINNTGSITLPTVLPIQFLCDQIYLLTGQGKGLVLFSAKYSKFEIVGLLGGEGTNEAAPAPGPGVGDGALCMG